jgi:lipoate-protein ligase A
MNMAIDEAILKARTENLVPATLRLYRWNPSAVSIGRFQNIESEVQLDNCRKYGVDVVRRITGGGTVYHDSKDEITYSVVVGERELRTCDIGVTYCKIYSGLVEALRVLGIEADFDKGNTKTCPNLTIRGRKISGSAQSHRLGVVLQHGTLLNNVNLERMFALLRVPWASTCMEVVNIARKKITSIRNELGKSVSLEEMKKALIKGFQRALNAELTEGKMTTPEFEFAERLCMEKYVTDDWNSHGISDNEKH